MKISLDEMKLWNLCRNSTRIHLFKERSEFNKWKNFIESKKSSHFRGLPWNIRLCSTSKHISKLFEFSLQKLFVKTCKNLHQQTCLFPWSWWVHVIYHSLHTQGIVPWSLGIALKNRSDYHRLSASDHFKASPNSV